MPHYHVLGNISEDGLQCLFVPSSEKDKFSSKIFLPSLAGPDYNVHQRFKPVTQDLLHQNDRCMAHLQSQPSLHRGPDSHLQGKKKL